MGWLGITGIFSKRKIENLNIKLLLKMQNVFRVFPAFLNFFPTRLWMKKHACRIVKMTFFPLWFVCLDVFMQRFGEGLLFVFPHLFNGLRVESNILLNALFSVDILPPPLFSSSSATAIKCRWNGLTQRFWVKQTTSTCWKDVLQGTQKVACLSRKREMSKNWQGSTEG